MYQLYTTHYMHRIFEVNLITLQSVVLNLGQDWHKKVQERHESQAPRYQPKTSAFTFFLSMIKRQVLNHTRNPGLPTASSYSSMCHGKYENRSSHAIRFTHKLYRGAQPARRLTGSGDLIPIETPSLLINSTWVLVVGLLICTHWVKRWSGW